MPRSITAVLRFQNEHAKGQTGFDVHCIPNKPKRLGWERRHYFKVDGLGERAQSALKAGKLMIRVKGKRYIYKWEEPRVLTEIFPKPLDEVFKVKSSSKDTANDNHFEGTYRVPPYCGWWGYGKYDLTLVVAKWKDEATAKEYAEKLGRPQNSSEAPDFAHNNRDDDYAGLENQPTFDDVRMDPLDDEGDKNDPYKGTLKYAYLPIHCGDMTIEQVLANPDAKAAMLKELEKYNGGGDAPKTLDDIVKTRDDTLKSFVGSIGVPIGRAVGFPSLTETGSLASMVSQSSQSGSVLGNAPLLSVGWAAPMFPVEAGSSAGEGLQSTPSTSPPRSVPAPNQQEGTVSPTEHASPSIEPVQVTVRRKI